MNKYRIWNIRLNSIKGKKDCVIYYVSRGCINNDEIWNFLNTEATNRNIVLAQVNQYEYKALSLYVPELKESIID